MSAPAGGKDGDSQLTRTYDLVKEMQYLYVRVVKARCLPKHVARSYDLHVEVKLGNLKGTTRHFVKKSNPEWNQAFAFPEDQVHSSMLEATVKDKDSLRDDFVGRVRIVLDEVPKRVPQDNPVAPQWYKLGDRKEDEVVGELELAVWWGSQSDEAFHQAWLSDDVGVSGTEGLANIRLKEYSSPELRYLRLNVIEAQDLQFRDENRVPEVFVKAILGNQVLRTKNSPVRCSNPVWCEDLLFVVAEPFEVELALTVEEVGDAPTEDKIVARCLISLKNVENSWMQHSKWYELDGNVEEGEKEEKAVFPMINTRIHWEDAYADIDGCTHYSGDSTSKSIGVLEVEILNATGLSPTKTKDGRATIDAYCVAKYRNKWVRTRTVVDSFDPTWNEQYSWDVFDPCTVITIGVFDNCNLQRGATKDLRIGKVKIRLSTLKTNRVITYSHPLLVLHPYRVKKMGEIRLSVRFRCLSMIDMIHRYSQPLLPKLHYIRPFSVAQHDSLRHYSIQLVSMRLSRAEPPLRKEVVEYMLEVGSQMWSLRRSTVNIFRIRRFLSGLSAVREWFDDICTWKNPIATVLIHILFSILVLYPKLIPPSITLLLSVITIWSYRQRPGFLSHVDTRLSSIDDAYPELHADELDDEEFDSLPTSLPTDIVRMRYDRLRSIAGTIQTVAGDFATQGERLVSILSWRDPRASFMFVIFCSLMAIFLSVTPFRVVALLVGFYTLRYPWFRSRTPSMAHSFLKRLPVKSDCIL